MNNHRYIKDPVQKIKEKKQQILTLHSNSRDLAPRKLTD
jgi:hypothetical protein